MQRREKHNVEIENRWIKGFFFMLKTDAILTP